MDVYDKKQRQRLVTTIEQSYRALQPFRRLIAELVRETAGPEYGNENSSAPRREQLLNLMHQAMTAYTMSLAANRPQVLVSTPYENLNSFAAHFQQATNNLLEEIDFEATLQRWVLDAFYCVGIIKVHLADSGIVEMAPDLLMDPGKPFASNISLENFSFDTTAKRWSEVRWAADSYRIPFEDLSDPNLFDQQAVRKLSPTDKNNHGSEERLDEMTSGTDVSADELEPMIDLIDVWIPADEMIYTFPLQSSDGMKINGRPIAEMRWDGPEHGPYHLLSFVDVPDNVMPASVASHLSALARLANNLMRKAKRQAQRARNVNTYTPSGADDARKVKTAGDGEWVEVREQSEVNMLSVPGVDQGNHAFLLDVIDKFDRSAGNLQAKMGLGTSAGTVGQEKLLHGAASSEEAHLQNRVMRATTSLVRDLGHMLWQDQATVLPGRMEIEGSGGLSVDATWSPEDREGDFLQYNFAIDIYSMSYQSPQSRLEALNGVVTGVYGPMMQMLMAQGGQIDMQRLTEIYAELLHEPRLKQVIRFGQPRDMGQPPPAGMPNNTTREYVRHNVPTGGTAQSRSTTLQQALLAGSANQDQMAALQQPAGAI